MEVETNIGGIPIFHIYDGRKGHFIEILLGEPRQFSHENWCRDFGNESSTKSIRICSMGLEYLQKHPTFTMKKWAIHVSKIFQTSGQILIFHQPHDFPEIAGVPFPDTKTLHFEGPGRVKSDPTQRSDSWGFGPYLNFSWITWPCEVRSSLY